MAALTLYAERITGLPPGVLVESRPAAFVPRGRNRTDSVVDPAYCWLRGRPAN